MLGEYNCPWDWEDVSLDKGGVGCCIEGKGRSGSLAAVSEILECCCLCLYCPPPGVRCSSICSRCCSCVGEPKLPLDCDA